MIELFRMYLGFNMLIAGFLLSDIDLPTIKKFGWFSMYLLFGIPILIYKTIWQNT